MRRILLLFCLSILTTSLIAQGFTIERYEIDLELLRDGSLNVTENIGVHFYESKQGIIRDLPYRYQIKGSSLSKPIERQLIYSDIRVKDKKMQLEKSADEIHIRIGTPGQYLTGLQNYQIQYKVYGAADQFQHQDELAWNIIGHQWPCLIKEVSFRLRLEAVPNLASSDIRYFYGPAGAQEQQHLHIEYKAGVLSGYTTKPLLKGEGLSLALRLPKDYFPDDLAYPLSELRSPWFIHALDAQADLLRNGSLRVQETWRIGLNSYQPEISFRLPIHIPGQAYYLSKFSSALREGKTKDLIPAKLSINRMGQGYIDHEIRFPDTIHKELEITFRYILWGAIQSNQLTWRPHQLPEDIPVGRVKLRLNYPEGWDLNPNVWLPPANMRLENFKNHVVARSMGPQQPSKAFRLELEHIQLPLEKLDLSMVPAAVYAREYTVGDLQLDLSFDETGRLFVEQSFSSQPLISGAAAPIFNIPKRYRPNSWQSNIRILEPPNNNPFQDYYYFLVDNINVPSSVEWRGGEDNYLFEWPKSTDTSLSNLSYELYGLWKNQSNGSLFRFPIYMERAAPTEGFSLDLALPAEWAAQQGASFQLLFLSKNSTYKNKIKEVVKLQPLTDGLLTYESGRSLRAGEAIVLEVLLPEAGPTGSFWSDLRLYWANYWLLVLPFILFLILFPLWWFLGRDPKEPLVIQYFPPENLNSAEAGLLWDFKLHRRDLISLIYYWAGRGHLRIREEGDEAHYVFLEKIKGLPNSAKKFERSLFDALFEDKEEVKLSDLRYNFAHNMKKAGVQLEEYGQRKNFFVPFSLGFSRLLFRTSLFVGIATICTVLFYWADESVWRYDAAIGFGLSSAILYYFSCIVPRHGHLSKQQYQQLRGFKAFIKRCEQERLRQLLKQHPAYFEETISFAIVLGLGPDWAKKFEGLLTRPPSWYQGYNSASFNSYAFTQHALSKMYQMETALTSQYRSGGGSYSSSSSSSSYSSSSSSSFSSGSSYSSGAGFGGGGGSSW